MSNLRDQETRGRRYDVINHTQLEHERMIPNRPESPQTFYRMSKMNFPKGDALVDMKQRPPPLKSIAKEWGLDV